MYKIQIKSLIATLLLCTFAVSAGLYKGLDEDGNVSYSDKPFENAEEIAPPPITVLDARKVPAKTETNKDASESTESAEVAKYTGFKISTPKDGETIWNATEISVAVSMTPGLDTKHGHTIWLIVDGKALIKNGRSPLMKIQRHADRGTRKVQAQIRNQKGKILNRSKNITVYIKKTSVR